MSGRLGKAETLKAFAVTEEDEGTGGIVFAKSAIAARRIGANEYADGEFAYVLCRRAPWADECAADGDVPVWLMVEHGWHFECQGCGRRIDSDMLWERDIKPEDIIGTQRTSAYCNDVCRAREALHRAEANRAQIRWIRRFRKIIKARFPNAEIVAGEGFGRGAHAYASKRNGVWRIEQVNVQFEFPGMTIAPATLRYDRTQRTRNAYRPNKPHWSCCAGDKEAFEAFAKAERIAA